MNINCSVRYKLRNLLEEVPSSLTLKLALWDWRSSEVLPTNYSAFSRLRHSLSTGSDFLCYVYIHLMEKLCAMSTFDEETQYETLPLEIINTLCYQ